MVLNNLGTDVIIQKVFVTTNSDRSRRIRGNLSIRAYCVGTIVCATVGQNEQ